MKKLMKTRNAMLYVYLFIAAGVLLVWRGGTIVTKKLDDMPFKRLERSIAKPGLVDTKNFYPVWVKQAPAIRAEALAAGAVDSLFRKPEEPMPLVEAPVRPPEPDYLAIVRQTALVDAISDNGAVINGRFYSIGGRLEDLAFMPAGKTPVVPVIAGLQGNQVMIKVDKKVVVLSLVSSTN